MISGQITKFAIPCVTEYPGLVLFPILDICQAIL